MAGLMGGMPRMAMGGMPVGAIPVGGIRPIGGMPMGGSWLTCCIVNLPQSQHVILDPKGSLLNSLSIARLQSSEHVGRLEKFAVNTLPQFLWNESLNCLHFSFLLHFADNSSQVSTEHSSIGSYIFWYFHEILITFGSVLLCWPTTVVELYYVAKGFHVFSTSFAIC